MQIPEMQIDIKYVNKFILPTDSDNANVLLKYWLFKEQDYINYIFDCHIAGKTIKFSTGTKEDGMKKLLSEKDKFRSIENIASKWDSARGIKIIIINLV